MNYTRNKLMAWFLTLAMILTMLPVFALPAVAEGTSVDFSGGSDYTGEDGFDDGSGDVLPLPPSDEEMSDEEVPGEEMPDEEVPGEEMPGEPNYAISVIVGGVELTDGDYLGNDGNIYDEAPEGGYAHLKDGVLTLSDFVYEGSGYVYAEDTDGETYYEISSALIYAPASLEIRLVGENHLVNTILEEDFPVQDVDNIGIDLDGDGIYAESALAISGTGSLAVTVDNDGIYSIGGFTVSEAVSLTIEAGDDSIYSERHVTLSGTGSLTVVAGDDGIDVEDMDGQSSFTMTSGALIVDAIDHGLELSPGVDSTVACNVNISGGKITITTEEDEGIYVNGGSMVISGGEVYVNAADDGIDLNSLEVYDEETGDYKYYGGSLTITGGTVEVISVDYPITAQGDLTISGGSVMIESESPLSVSGEVIIDEENATVVFAAPVFVAGVKLVEGEYLGNDGNIYDEAPEGGYAHYDAESGTLTLSDFVYEGEGYLYDNMYTSALYAVGDLVIVLEGTSSLKNTASDTDGVTVENGDLFIRGDGSLYVEAQYGIYNYGGNVTISSGTVRIRAEVDTIYADGEMIIDEENATVISLVSVYVAGVKLNDGEYLANGATEATTEKPEGGYAHLKDGVLTLSDFVYEGIGHVYDEYEGSSEDEDGVYTYYNASSATIYAPAPLEIRLVGENRLANTLSEEDFADKGVDELHVYGDGIYAGGDLTISGTGSLAVVVGGDGIYSERNVTISGTGSLTVVADDDGICSDGDLTISGAASLTIEVGDDGICSDGDLTISGGNVTVDAGYWGISTYGNVTIEDANVDILAVHEGIRVNASEEYDEELGEWIQIPSHMTVSGGSVEIQAADGIYVYEGDVTVSGGSVEIQTAADGIYVSNGNVTVSGGSVEIQADYIGIYTEGDVSISGGSMDIISPEPFFVAGELTFEDYVVYEQRGENLWVVRLNINQGALDFELDEIVYNGEAQTPAFTLTVGEKILVEGVDFTVTYANNVNAGTATMTVKGIGGCEGEKTATFEILPIVVDLVWGNTALEYNGKPQVPTVTVVGMLEGDERFITVSGNGKYEGTFTATVTLSNPNYVIAGNDTIEYTIWADPYKVVGDLIPDDVKTAVSDAVSDMVSEVVTEVSDALVETIEDAVGNLLDNLWAKLADEWNDLVA